MRQARRVFIAILTYVALMSSWVFADEQIGAFRVFDDHPNVVALDGEIGINTPLDFRRALAAAPEATLIVLNSPGGLVASGLILANDIHDRGLSTAIPMGAGCYSACAFAFFAGSQRLAEGELGVHQMYGNDDTSGVQAQLSDIIEALERFDTPTAVVTRMFRTPSEDMYIFSQDELEELKVNILGSDVLADVSGFGLVSAAASIEEPALSKTPLPTGVEENPGLRLALYGGLDFYGSDISSERTVDAVECASMCLFENQCVAFTFNANPNLTRGPNCFLKGGFDRLEAYSDAMSGVFLGPDSGEAITFSIGAIDPTEDVLPRQGLSGGDFVSSPEEGISSPGACRMACVDSNACQAFTFDSRLDQCTLKHSVGTAFSSGSMISGVKRGATFAPIDVIDLSE